MIIMAKVKPLSEMAQKVLEVLKGASAPMTLNDISKELNVESVATGVLTGLKNRGLVAVVDTVPATTEIVCPHCGETITMEVKGKSVNRYGVATSTTKTE